MICCMGKIQFWQGAKTNRVRVREGFWRGLDHHHHQEDACEDLYITSLSPDNLAGAEEVIGWGGRSSPREKCGRR